MVISPNPPHTHLVRASPSSPMEESDNSSSVCYPPLPQPHLLPLPQPPPDPAPTTELVALRLLSSNLENLLRSEAFADAHISLPSHHTKLPVHRCLLSVRSPFFHDLFARSSNDASVLDASQLLPDLGVGPDALRYVLCYVYTSRVEPLPRDASWCADSQCPHAGCRPAVEFMLEVLYASFVFQIFELVSLFQRRLLDILGEVREDDLLRVLSVAALCVKSCEKLLDRCIDLAVRSSHDLVTLEKALSPAIVEQIVDARGPEATGAPNKHVKRILRALDSDDVELLNLLLKESDTTLDDAYALHYAVAHCNSKVINQLLDLGLADVNLRNPRGYTVLHAAAMRKEPLIIISLLGKGARPSETTPDGRKAVKIARQVTKYSEFHRSLENGTEAPTDRLCIEILENAEFSNRLAPEAADIFTKAGKDFEERLQYLETRVGLAKLFFPQEARIAMENAKVNGSSEFGFISQCSALQGGLQPDLDGILKLGRESSCGDDLNQTPFNNQTGRLLRAMELSKTIETAKRFFPRCTTVIDRYMDHDTDLLFQGNEASEEERKLKRKRYEQLQEEFAEAFFQDKKALNRKGEAFSRQKDIVNASSSSGSNYNASRATRTKSVVRKG